MTSTGTGGSRGRGKSLAGWAGVALSASAALALVGAGGAKAQIVAPVSVPATAPEQAARESASSSAVDEMNAGEFAALVEKLNDAEVRVRDQSTAKLLDDPKVTLAQVERAIKNRERPLSLEQRTRLLVVARDRFMKGDRAALGFQFGGQLQDRIVVGQTFPKFASHRFLEAGDIIIEADGVALPGASGRPAMQAIIVSHEPGEELKLKVRRGKQKLDLSVPLGRFSDLEQPGMPVQAGASRPPEYMMERAWKVRAKRMSPETLEVGGFAEAWKLRSQAERDRRRDLINKRMNGAVERPAVVGGGMARMSAIADDGMDPTWQGNVRQQAQLRAIRQGGMVIFGDFDEESGFPRSTPAQELSMLAQAKAQAGQEVQSLRDPRTFAPGTDRLSQIAEANKRLAIIDRQIEAIETEIRERGETVPVIKTPQLVEPGREAKE